MKIYRINGGTQVSGTIKAMCAKNAFSKQIVASLLSDEPSIFYNAPKISETTITLDMLSELGVKYTWLKNGSLEINSKNIKTGTISEKYSGYNRIPILLLAPLLHRTHEVSVPVVGGCKIGQRPINFHLVALEKMGAKVIETESGYHASSKRLIGTSIELPYPSVGATENIIMGAVLAKGTTVINNAAVEPEIIDTIVYLQKMGALIRVDVDRRIIIDGVEKLHGATHKTIADRIEVASNAVLAVASDGDITIEGAQQETMITFLNNLRKAGGDFEVIQDYGIRFFKKDTKFHPLQLETDVHPGFMTDWQQPFVLLLTQAEGISIMHETVYENRFGYTNILKNMGANIQLSTNCLGGRACRFKNRDFLHSCIIKGKTKLHGANIEIPDLRAGFAYLIAAVLAKGTTEISGIQYIERGYENVVKKMKKIGVNIEVINKK